MDIVPMNRENVSQNDVHDREYEKNSGSDSLTTILSTEAFDAIQEVKESPSTETVPCRLSEQISDYSIQVNTEETFLRDNSVDNLSSMISANALDTEIFKLLQTMIEKITSIDNSQARMTQVQGNNHDNQSDLLCNPVQNSSLKEAQTVMDTSYPPQCNEHKILLETAQTYKSQTACSSSSQLLTKVKDEKQSSCQTAELRGRSDSFITRNNPAFLPVKKVFTGKMKRVDPLVDQVFKEALKQQHEIEKLREVQTLWCDEEEWVDMNHPTTGTLCYYGKVSGNMTTSRLIPYITLLERDDLLRMVIKIQCAYRMRIARRKLHLMKSDKSNSLESIAGSRNSVDYPWIEIYDPAEKTLFYYCEITGAKQSQPPPYYISLEEDKQLKAIIAIQAIARSHLSRKYIKKKQLEAETRRHEQANLLREYIQDQGHFGSILERDKSVAFNRLMEDEEKSQISFGDTFWGVEKYIIEVLRQRLEEKNLQEAEEFWFRLNNTLRAQTPTQVFLLQQLTLESNASNTDKSLSECVNMQREEREQNRFGDKFWGFRVEEIREREERQGLMLQDNESKDLAEQIRLQNIHDECQIRAHEEYEAQVNGVKKIELMNQRRYFEWFYSENITAEDILQYVWPISESTVPPICTIQCTNVEPICSQNPIARKKVLQIGLMENPKYRGQPVPLKNPYHRTSSINKRNCRKMEIKSNQLAPAELMKKVLENEAQLPVRRVKSPNVPARYNGIPFHSQEVQSMQARELLESGHIKQKSLPSLKLVDANRIKKATKIGKNI